MPAGDLFERPQLPWRVRAANALGPLGVRLGWARETSFDVDGLLADARRATGLDDFGPDDFHEPLRVLADALDHEARLTFDGRRAVRQQLVGALRNRLLVARDAHREPEIAARPIERPVFIIGLLRTGSTLLHNLLAQHPGLRVPLLWELGTPASPSPGPEAEAALARATQAYVDEYYRVAPRLPSVHFIDALRPDECHRLLSNAFMSMVYSMRYEVPTYARYLAEHDSTPAYRYHRAQLQHILRRKPGAPVVLKCPFHVWTLPALVEVYPDARLVHLHRDPAKVVPSTCSLCLVVRGARAARINLTAIGRQWLESTAAALERLPRFRREHPQAHVLDVPYHELMRDTFGTVARICDFIGVPLGDDARAAMRRWLADNPQDRHGRHHYTPAQFGLDPRQVGARFADYRRAYDVEAEA